MARIAAPEIAVPCGNTGVCSVNQFLSKPLKFSENIPIILGECAQKREQPVQACLLACVMRRTKNSRQGQQGAGLQMFFLLRVAFWLTIVLALLPTGTTQPSTEGSRVNTTEAVVAAGAAVADVSHFCERQAEACAVGSQTAIAIGQRAQAGARMVYDFINDRMARSETGSIPATAPPSHPSSQSTLRPADLAPAWHGPAALKATVPARGAAQRNVTMPRPDPRKALHPPA